MHSSVAPRRMSINEGAKRSLIKESLSKEQERECGQISRPHPIEVNVIIENDDDSVSEDEGDLLSHERESSVRKVDTWENNHQQNIACINKFDASEVVSVSEMKIPPYCEVVFLGKVKRALSSPVAVIEEVRLGSPFVHIAKAIVDVNSEFPLKAINASPTEFCVRKGQIVGVALSAEEDCMRRLDNGLEVKGIETSRKEWLKGFNLDHMAPDVRAQVEGLLVEFSDLFRDDEDIVQTCKGVKHSIVLEPGAVPVYKKPYRIPYRQREVVKGEIDRLLKAKVIRPSVSPWSSPIVLVTKRLPDGRTKIRMCVDYRGLNAVTKREYFPLPCISDLVQSFRADKNLRFSLLDLSEAYHHIPVDEASIPYTAFSTYEGHYEYLKLPFGLCHAPVTFQKYINFLFHGLLNETVLVYLDDIVIYTYDGVEKHLNMLKEVFTRLREANLQLKPEKCSFLMHKVRYLGHILSTSGISPEPNKIQEIKGIPIPKNVKGVRQFLGAVNFYRKFIPDMAKKASPLVKLTKKGIPFKITEEVLESFETLKNDLSSDSLLVFPDFSKPFLVASDASRSGLGAVLSQVCDGYERIITLASRRLTKAEANYSVSELEMLGVTFAVKQFRCYIYNSKFTVVTDHMALKYLLTKGISHSTNSRLMRFALLLSEYEFEVVYRKGRNHCNADLFSRKYDRNDYYTENAFEDFENYKLEHAPLRNADVGETQKSLCEIDKGVAIAHWVPEVGKLESPMDRWIVETYGSWRDPHMTEGLGEVVKLRNNTRDVYALIAHNPRFGQTSYEIIFQCLKQLKEHCFRDEVRDICINKIEHDDIDDLKVKEMIHFVFYGSHIKVTVCNNTKPGATVNHIRDGDVAVEPQWDRFDLKQAQQTDEFCRHILTLLDEGEEATAEVYFKDEGVLYRKNLDETVGRLVIPQKYVNKCLSDFHDKPWAGHSGRARTEGNIKKRFFWPSMHADIIKYCDTCVACNRRKTSPHFRRVPLLKFETVREPFELCSLDIVGPLVTSYNGNKYILTFMDYFTRYSEAIAVPDIKAETVARAFVEQVVCRHGCPEKLLTDRGTNFMSEVFKEVCSLLQTKQLHTASYAPSTNGLIERFHRTLKDMLAHYVERSQRNWDQVLPYILLAYRMTDHSATGFSPHFLLYGRECVLPVDKFVKIDRPHYGENYVAEMLTRMKEVTQQVIERNAKSIDTRNAYSNRGRKERKYELGDLVYVKNEASEEGVSRKLASRWLGPYRVTDVITPVTYRVQKTHSRLKMTVHANRLKKCYLRDNDESETMPNSERQRPHKRNREDEEGRTGEVPPEATTSSQSMAFPWLLPDTVVNPQVIPERVTPQPRASTPETRVGGGSPLRPSETLEDRQRQSPRARQEISQTEYEPEVESRPRRTVRPPERYDSYTYRRSNRNRRPPERYHPGLFTSERQRGDDSRIDED